MIWHILASVYIVGAATGFLALITTATNSTKIPEHILIRRLLFWPLFALRFCVDVLIGQKRFCEAEK